MPSARRPWSHPVSPSRSWWRSARSPPGWSATISAPCSPSPRSCPWSRMCSRRTPSARGYCRRSTSARSGSRCSSSAMSLRSRLEEPRTWFAISCGAFLAFYGIVLHRLPHNLDEGVNLFDARFIAMGQRPYDDFFYHQLPLHLYVLSFVSSVAPDSLYLHRLPALLAVAATGGVLYVLTARLTSSAVAALAAAVYYAMPLQHLALLVLPNSPMLFFSTSAILLMLLDDRPARVTLGAVCFLLAVLWKPLALATV